MAPESHPAAFDVDVCATESVFVHVTVVPAATSRPSGLKARFPRVDAPLGMLMGVDDPDGVGTGVGEGDGDGDGDE
jgi:hypothetical protein